MAKILINLSCISCGVVWMLYLWCRQFNISCLTCCLLVSLGLPLSALSYQPCLISLALTWAWCCVGLIWYVGKRSLWLHGGERKSERRVRTEECSKVRLSPTFTSCMLNALIFHFQNQPYFHKPQARSTTATYHHHQTNSDATNRSRPSVPAIHVLSMSNVRGIAGRQLFTH